MPILLARQWGFGVVDVHAAEVGQTDVALELSHCGTYMRQSDTIYALSVLRTG